MSPLSRAYMTTDGSATSKREQALAEDPVLAAIARARLRQPLPEKTRTALIALDAEATSDPSTWRSFDGLLAEVAALRPAE
jgi:hypothetical protein